MNSRFAYSALFDSKHFFNLFIYFFFNLLSFTCIFMLSFCIVFYMFCIENTCKYMCEYCTFVLIVNINKVNLDHLLNAMFICLPKPIR